MRARQLVLSEISCRWTCCRHREKKLSDGSDRLSITRPRRQSRAASVGEKTPRNDCVTLPTSPSMRPRDDCHRSGEGVVAVCCILQPVTGQRRGVASSDGRRLTAHFTRVNLQEAQLSPSDRAMRLVSSNLANCHATEQKLLIRQVLTKLMV